MDGLLVIDKPAGWTSFDVVAKLRRLSGERRVGHAGTLDPPATGVLVVCFGQATRLVEHLTGLPKTYEAEFVYGATTTTDDADGAIVATADTTSLTERAVRAALRGLVGEIRQAPPHVSAVKVHGQRAYALTRAGAPPPLAPRTVRVDSITVTAICLPRVTVTVQCGSGTYIRSLARDSGATLGVGGHVGWLRRVAVGPFTVVDAIPLAEAIAAASAGQFRALLRPIAAGLVGWRILTVDDATASRLCRGQAIPATDPADERAAAVTATGRVVALLAREDGQWRPRKVLASEPAREQPA